MKIREMGKNYVLSNDDAKREDEFHSMRVVPLSFTKPLAYTYNRKAATAALRSVPDDFR